VKHRPKEISLSASATTAIVPLGFGVYTETVKSMRTGPFTDTSKHNQLLQFHLWFGGCSHLSQSARQDLRANHSGREQACRKNTQVTTCICVCCFDSCSRRKAHAHIAVWRESGPSQRAELSDRIASMDHCSLQDKPERFGIVIWPKSAVKKQRISDKTHEIQTCFWTDEKHKAVNRASNRWQTLMLNNKNLFDVFQMKYCHDHYHPIDERCWCW